MKFKTELKLKLLELYVNLNKKVNPYPPLRVSEDIYSHFPPYIIKALYDLSRANNPKVPASVLMNMLKSILRLSELETIKNEDGYKKYKQDVDELVDKALSKGRCDSLESNLNNIIEGNHPEVVKLQLKALKKSIEFTRSTISDFKKKIQKELSINTGRMGLVKVLTSPLPKSLSNLYKIDPPMMVDIVRKYNNYTIVVGVDATGSMRTALNGSSTFIVVSGVLDTLLEESPKMICFTFRSGSITEEFGIKLVDRRTINNFKNSIHFVGGPTDIPYVLRDLSEQLIDKKLQVQKPIFLFLITDDTDSLTSTDIKYIKEILEENNIILAIIHVGGDSEPYGHGHLKEAAHKYINIP